jgi:hypothetical protein
VYLKVMLLPCWGSPLSKAASSVPVWAIWTTLWGLSALAHSQVISVPVEILTAAGSKPVSASPAPTPTYGIPTTMLPS